MDAQTNHDVAQLLGHFLGNIQGYTGPAGRLLNVAVQMAGAGLIKHGDNGTFTRVKTGDSLVVGTLKLFGKLELREGDYRLLTKLQTGAMVVPGVTRTEGPHSTVFEYLEIPALAPIKFKEETCYEYEEV